MSSRYEAVAALIDEAASGAAAARPAPRLATWMRAPFGEVHTCGSKRNSGSSPASSGGNGHGATSTRSLPRSIV